MEISVASVLQGTMFCLNKFMLIWNGESSEKIMVFKLIVLKLLKNLLFGSKNFVNNIYVQIGASHICWLLVLFEHDRKKYVSVSEVCLDRFSYRDSIENQSTSDFQS